ncbi:MAG: hypothetical protein GX095_05625 [Clostridiales bacterium]|nr:hypothetical protein [Clostridiales bacterium]
MDKLAEKVNALISAIAEGDKSALGKLYGPYGGVSLFYGAQVPCRKLKKILKKLKNEL